MNSLRNPAVRQVLEELHEAAKSDRGRFLRLLPWALYNRLRGKELASVVTPEQMEDFYIPVDPEQGELLYLLARATGARHVVEFGTSFGISAIYLSAAVRDNGGGAMIGTELLPSKHAAAVSNLRRCGLDDVADIRLGDALETLKELPGPVDMVLLDGWKDLYIPVLEVLKPQLRHGALVIADNILTFKKALRPYVEYMQSGKNGFESCSVHFSEGFEVSVYLPD